MPNQTINSPISVGNKVIIYTKTTSCVGTISTIYPDELILTDVECLRINDILKFKDKLKDKIISINRSAIECVVANCHDSNVAENQLLRII